MRDIFAAETTDGAYGIDALTKVAALGNTFYDLVDRTYLDDKKFALDDLFDISVIGPTLVAQAQDFAIVAGQIDEEILDLSEAEKATLRNLAAERIEDPSYRKIVSGLLELIDGVSEKMNKTNPVG